MDVNFDAYKTSNFGNIEFPSTTYYKCTHIDTKSKDNVAVTGAIAECKDSNHLDDADNCINNANCKWNSRCKIQTMFFGDSAKENECLKRFDAMTCQAYKGASTSPYCEWLFDTNIVTTGFCIPDEILKDDSLLHA